MSPKMPVFNQNCSSGLLILEISEAKTDLFLFH